MGIYTISNVRDKYTKMTVWPQRVHGIVVPSPFLSYNFIVYIDYQ